MNTFGLRVITPAGEVYSGEVEYLCLETPDGKVGIMHGALPRVITLATGNIEIKTSVLTTNIACSGGVACVKGDGVVVLSEECSSDDATVMHGMTQSVDNDITDSEYKRVKVNLAASVKKIKRRRN